MEEVKVNITPSGNEVIIRQGQAAPIYEKPSISLEGTIRSVLNFDEKRADTYIDTTVHVLMDWDKGIVVLVAKEQDKDKFTVSGSLIQHPFVDELAINEQKFISVAQLYFKLKLNRQYFGARDVYENLLNNLKKLEVNIASTFKDQNDFAGTVLQQNMRQATHNVPTSFELKVPIYQGYQPETINVEIEVIPDGTTIKVSLVSLDLIERQTAIKEGLFEEVKKTLGAKYAIIEK